MKTVADPGYVPSADRSIPSMSPRISFALSDTSAPTPGASGPALARNRIPAVVGWIWLEPVVPFAVLPLPSWTAIAEPLAVFVPLPPINAPVEALTVVLPERAVTVDVDLLWLSWTTPTDPVA